MFTLVHMSDLHMASRPKGAELISKRGLGLINWHRKRGAIHRREVLDALVHDVKAVPHDHVAVTGDLVNFSLPEEYDWARALLDTLGSPRDVTVIPGNHDVYVRAARNYAEEYWADFMRGDDGVQRFPFLRRRGDVTLIALSTGLPTGPFMATGRLGKRQLARLAELLDQTRGQFRIVLIHHPAQTPLRRFLRRLVDGAALRDVLAEKGAELLLHGHDHIRSVIWLDGAQGKFPAVGVPSASAITRHHDEDEAGYNIFQIEPTITPSGSSKKWRCTMIARQRDTNGTVKETSRRELF
ncbi:MAG TPA: metallophosphoesterase [Xanthobacteraceae bacterium]|jgi:3',5'-cyclic AMP phosphodiesterase CpdA|nr:metallophosphoesterase [Xanthobacteraceae bacterium]